MGISPIAVLMSFLIFCISLYSELPENFFEIELVNKQLTNRLIQRQKQIITRLLEAENANRERELDDEREAEQAKKIIRNIPDTFEEYIKAKEKEIELLKTVPLNLNPYFKKEVNEYFKRLGS